MNEHEKALPAGGPAKFTQNAVKIYGVLNLLAQILEKSLK